MAEQISLPGRPGFQGSESSGAEVVFYGQEGDPITLHGGSVPTTGRKRGDKEPSLISVGTNKQMGVASGQWSVTLKQPKGIDKSIFDLILDDDWIDISFYRHWRKWHVMRGLVDEVREAKAVSGTGTTTEAYTITGRCFGKIWEQTPIFFSIYTDDVVTGGIAYQVFTGATNVLGSPDKAVEGYLFGFLKAIGDVGRANWVIPAGIPNIGGSFADNAFYDTWDFTNTPPRYALNPNFLNPQGTLWQLAQEWSDPMFLELFTDTLPGAWRELTSNIDEMYDNEITRMYVILRDRPFPTIEQGKDSPWFSLPLFEIPRQMVTDHEIGRGGHERYNAFFVSPQLTQSLLGMGTMDLVKPLWNKDDIFHHGLRRFDITSKYLPDDMDLATMTNAQREQVRDWYCLNAYMFSGTIGFGMGLPNLRIGTRLRIKDADENKDETYYVESVSNNWVFRQGVKTSAGVTRGWVGTDDSYMAALTRMTENYQEPIQAAPEDTAYV